MQKFELTVLARNGKEREAVAKATEVVGKFGGIVTKYEFDGTKRLAYPISEQDFADYCYLDIELPDGAAAKISSALNVEDTILRYLLVGCDPRRKPTQVSQERKLASEIVKLVESRIGAVFSATNRSQLQDAIYTKINEEAQDE